VLKNFYAIDIETNGFEYNEPLQIAIVLYKDGKIDTEWNKYFKSKYPCTPSARDTHNLTKDKLKKLSATLFGLRSCKWLRGIWNAYPEYPIVAHNVDYDLY
jgi:DNA polymerase III epsilon subunit-like protein